MVTHPSASGGPSSPALAGKFIQSLVEEARVQIWTGGSGFAGRLLESAVELAITGPRIFDLQIAMIAIDNGADEIWTHDRDFLRIRGLRVFDPLK